MPPIRVFVNQFFLVVHDNRVYANRTGIDADIEILHAEFLFHFFVL